jgi:hypothetical protein
MVSRCANPQCLTPFKYFSHGKLFLFDLAERGTFAREVIDNAYWLCDACCKKYEIVVRDGVAGVVPFVPKKQPLSEADENRVAGQAGNRAA